MRGEAGTITAVAKENIGEMTQAIQGGIQMAEADKMECKMNKEQNLINAVRYDKLQEVKDLVSQGTDIHAKNEEALYWVADNDHLDVVKYLVD